MSGRKIQPQNEPVSPENKGDWPTASSRVSPALSLKIDQAALALSGKGSKRVTRSMVVEQALDVFVKIVLGKAA